MKRVDRHLAGIAFDLEGTLINVETYHFQAFSMAMRDVAGVEITFLEILETVPYALGGGDHRIARELAAATGEDVAWETVLEAKRKSYEMLISGVSITPRPGAREVISEFIALGFQVAIGSLTPRKQAEHLLHESGLLKMFRPECFVFAEDVLNKKPAGDVYIKTALRMGIDPRQQLVFDDSDVGLEAARSAKSTAIGMPVFHLRDTLATLGHAGPARIFYDWREVNVLALIENLEQELREQDHGRYSED
jgi:beta-phosphoglucomutase-like phosphatase (HAD superfamily)